MRNRVTLVTKDRSISCIFPTLYMLGAHTLVSEVLTARRLLLTTDCSSSRVAGTAALLVQLASRVTDATLTNWPEAAAAAAAAGDSASSVRWACQLVP